MMSRILSFLVIVIVLGCNAGSQIPIDQYFSPDIQFYQQSANQILMHLDESTDKNAYILELISLYKKLGWPVETEKAFELAALANIPESLIINSKVDFLLRNGRMDELEKLLINDRITEELPIELQEKRIMILLNAGKIAQSEDALERLLAMDQSSDRLLFAANYYRQAADDSMAYVYAAQVFNEFKNDRSYQQFLNPILYKLDNFSQLVELYAFTELELINAQESKYLAEAHFKTNDMEGAKMIAFMHPTEYTSGQVAAWYVSSKKWDSAMVYVQRQRLITPNDVDVLMIASYAMEGKNDLQAAKSYIEMILQGEYDYQPAKDRYAELNRKIAYLRKFREIERRYTQPDFMLKKKTDQ